MLRKIVALEKCAKTRQQQCCESCSLVQFPYLMYFVFNVLYEAEKVDEKKNRCAVYKFMLYGWSLGDSLGSGLEITIMKNAFNMTIKSEPSILEFCNARLIQNEFQFGVVAYKSLDEVIRKMLSKRRRKGKKESKRVKKYSQFSARAISDKWARITLSARGESKKSWGR